MENYLKGGNNMQLKELSFEIIQKCPNNCIYCSSNSDCKSKHIINYDTFKRTIDDAVDLGLERLCISGGEPILHPEIVEYVQYSKNKNLEVYIYTSGIDINYLGCNDSISSTALKKLKAAGLDKLIFNVQSSDEKIYDKIMGTTNCFNLMKNSIKKSVELGLFCEIHFVPMGINFLMTHSVLEMAKELGVNKVSFLRLVVQGRALDNRDLVELSADMNEKLKSTLNTIEQHYKDINIRVGIPLSNNITYGCNASTSKLIIRYDGAVFPCEAFKYISAIDGEKAVKPDNINKSSLKDIYYRSEFLNILKGEIKEFKSQKLNCETCPAQWRLNKILSQ